MAENCKFEIKKNGGRRDDSHFLDSANLQPEIEGKVILWAKTSKKNTIRATDLTRFHLKIST